jgi:uncharacterized repeat protein (TIGR04052 family)
MHRLALLAALALAGCSPADQPVSIAFVAVAGEQPVSCSAGMPQLTDLRFFVHDVALIAADGRPVPITLDASPPWQGNGVALVDLEDGSGSCDTGSPMMHTAVTGRVAAGSYVGVRFVLGVPFDLNHADPDAAQPPLDQTAMHWHWLAGYKFLRAGLRRSEASTYLHLGSTGCAGRIGAVTGCKEPNRPLIALSRLDAARDVVAVDLAALFADTPTGACQSEPDNQVCAPLMKHLGLGGEQDVFRARAR